MNSRGIFFAACLSIAQARSDTATPTVSSNVGDRDQAGRELAQKVRSMAPQENSKASGVLKLRDRDGKISEVPVSCQVLAGGQTWQISYEAKGTRSEKLTILHAADQPNEYLYAKPANATARKLSSKEAAIPFAGSDFWLSDLGLEFLHWPKQRLVKTEMRSSRWCNVLESINPAPASGDYARVLSWLDKETGAPIMAEAYNAANQRVKEFAIKSVWKESGQPKEIEMRSVETKRRTWLQFDFNDSK